MATRIRIPTPDALLGWRDGLERIGDRFPDHVEPHWRDATDLFFDRTQSAVHIDTGDLKTSGRQAVYREGDETVVGEVAYGGTQGRHGPVDYAQYEHDRGGTHAFLDIGWELSEAAYRRALTLGWEDMIEEWGR